MLPGPHGADAHAARTLSADRFVHALGKPGASAGQPFDFGADV
jgi:hypothetical protein